jgi:hypothetical protein
MRGLLAKRRQVRATTYCVDCLFAVIVHNYLLTYSQGSPPMITDVAGSISSPGLRADGTCFVRPRMGRRARGRNAEPSHAEGSAHQQRGNRGDDVRQGDVLLLQLEILAPASVFGVQAFVERMLGAL